MRNLLMMGVVAICTSLLSCDTSMALGGNDGGGKNTDQARFVFTNTSSEAVRVLVLPAGAPLPSTVLATIQQSFVVGVDGSGNERVVDVPRDAGNYDIYVQNNLTIVTELRANPSAAPTGSGGDVATSVTLNGTNLNVAVSSASSSASIDGITQ